MNKIQTSRRRLILQMLRERGECSVDDLARACSVSDMTIRRMLTRLADEGQVVRTHGGASPASRVSFEFQFLRKSQIEPEAKDQIGAEAAKLVGDGQSIMLDSGSTTLALARQLTNRTGLTIITTSLPIASTMQQAPGVETLLLGGFVRREAPDLEGPLTEANLDTLRADMAFVGADGIDADGNVYNASLSVAKMLQKMVKAAGKTYVVADHTKLGRKALISFGNAREWAGLITDAGDDNEIVSQLRVAGVNIIQAGSAETRDEREAVHHG